MKTRKREEAIARQAAYDKLSLQQKYDKLATRPGESAKERKKLLKLMAKQHKCGADCKCGSEGVCCG